MIAYSEVMEIHFAPDVQAKLDRLVSETGCSPDEMLQDALAGYDLEFAQTREMLDGRSDDLKSGRVKPITGDKVASHFREKAQLPGVRNLVHDGSPARPSLGESPLTGVNL